jgi:hypothetical protein
MDDGCVGWRLIGTPSLRGFVPLPPSQYDVFCPLSCEPVTGYRVVDDGPDALRFEMHPSRWWNWCVQVARRNLDVCNPGLSLSLPLPSPPSLPPPAIVPFVVAAVRTRAWCPCWPCAPSQAWTGSSSPMMELCDSTRSVSLCPLPLSLLARGLCRCMFMCVYTYLCVCM